MIKSDNARVLIWQLEKLKTIELSDITRGTFTDKISTILSLENPLFIDAIFNIKAQVVESLRKVLSENLEKELAAIDGKISEDQATFQVLVEAAENAIGESLV